MSETTQKTSTTQSSPNLSLAYPLFLSLPPIIGTILSFQFNSDEEIYLLPITEVREYARIKYIRVEWKT